MRARRSWVLGVLVLVLATGCAEETGIHHGRLTVTSWELVAEPRDSVAPLRFAGVDSVWSAPGRQGAGGVRTSLAGPMTPAGPEWEPIRNMLQTMASGASLTPEDSLSLAGEAVESTRTWILQLPLGGGSRIRGRYPVSYRRLDSGAWAGEGPVRRDFLWVRRSDDLPDTVRIEIEGTLTDTVDIVGEARALDAEGALFVASLDRAVDLMVRMRARVTRIPEADVVRRHEETAARLERVLEGPER